MVKKHGNEDKDEVDGWQYDGAPEDWERFHSKVGRHARKRLSTLGDKFWMGTLPDLDELSTEDFTEHCEEVWDVIEERDSTRASRLYGRSSGFWTVKWQVRWRAREYQLLYDYVEARCTGTAESEMKSYSSNDHDRLRAKLFKQFGQGMEDDVHERERHYDAGMPDRGKVAFVPGADMRAKLRQLINEKHYFFTMCKKANRKDYVYCHDKKLVRIILDHIDAAYAEDISRLLATASLARQIEAVKSAVNANADDDGDSDGSAVSMKSTYSDLEDVDFSEIKAPGDEPSKALLDKIATKRKVKRKKKVSFEKKKKKVKVGLDESAVSFDEHDRTFSDAWLPTLGALKHCLINAWVKKSKSKTKEFNSGGGVPTMIGALGGDGKDLTCYGCGETGHRRGSDACAKGPDAVWNGAPARWKQRIAEFGKGGSGRGGSNSGGKRPCFAFDFGKGNCRFGEKCKFDHGTSGSSGGNRNKGPPLESGKFNKSQKKSISSMVAAGIKGELKAVVKAVKKKSRGKRKRDYSDDSDDSDDDTLGALIASVMKPAMFCPSSIRREKVGDDLQFKMPSLSTQLHDVKNNAGWDTDAGISISTEKKDFLWIDSSPEAIASMPQPHGINEGGGRAIGGIGPMVRRVVNGLVIAPIGVFLEKPGPSFCVFGAQGMKHMGVRTVQCFEDSERDVIQCRKSKSTVDLAEANGILVLPTCGGAEGIVATAGVRKLVSDIKNGRRSALVTLKDLEREEQERIAASMSKKGVAVSLFITAMLMATVAITAAAPTMVFSEAKLGKHDRSRLYSKKFGCCDTNLFPKMQAMGEVYGEMPELVGLNEDSVTMDEAKFRRKGYGKNDGTSMSQKIEDQEPWEIVYCDGVGGQKSMGFESYEGAIGEYMFACSGTGSKKVKLYSSNEQFPILLYHFLSQIEADRFRCRKIYVDTYSVNLSAEAHEVAAAFYTVLVPVSAGSPQELAFAESAHRVIAASSRAMILNAPHMPKFCWSMADLYSVYTNDFLPQKLRDFKSPYFLRTGKVIDWRRMCLHVWGCPVKYSPMVGPVHKRMELTEDGWFCGVQWPMVLVLRKSDLKVISVSTKKIKYYEAIYTKDLTEDPPTKEELEKHVTSGDMEWADENSGEEPGSENSQPDLPKHVLSVKSLSEFKTPAAMGNGDVPEKKIQKSATSNENVPGEGLYVPEHATLNMDRLVEDLSILKKRVSAEIAEPDFRARVIAKIQTAEDLMVNQTREKGALKVGKKKRAGNVDERNILPDAKRKKKNGRAMVPSAAGAAGARKGKGGSKKGAKLAKKKGCIFSVGDLISCDPAVFDGGTPGSFSDGRTDRCYGVVTRLLKKKSKIEVHFTEDGEKEMMPYSECRIEKKAMSTEVLLVCMMLEGKRPLYGNSDTKDWPKNFFEALCKSDWRDWVAAVKKELNSWISNEAYELVDFTEKSHGASCVPLGELFTRKRDDGAYKFRQYLMGNLMKEGKDFRDTFSTTVTWDGIRWCSSMACGCNKLVYGWDAVTGYLQAPERFDVYAFLPSHELYSHLEYEELAVLRAELLDLVAKEGPDGLKRFASKHKRDSRINPKQCMRLKKSVYGNPGAGHSFEMLLQGTHIKKCGMTQSEVEPSIYMRIQVDSDDKVVEYLVAYVWTDDCRYFGTDKMRLAYEKDVGSNLKVTFCGPAKSFVGVDMVQELDVGLLELKLPKYWEKAAQVFEEHFPKGFKDRPVPMAVVDEKVMEEEVTDEQFEDAKHLPFRQLAGVCSYPAACIKLEMRLAISVCGRYRGKWGLAQWNVLKKLFEYGYYTREIGLIYSRDLDGHGLNRIYAYADSSHKVPRSQGCEEVLMNGACLSLDSKRHIISGTSTCHDEIMSFAKAANKVEGFRNLMQEAGECQEEPTRIYQDNQATIQIAMNRGSLSSRSKHIDLKVLSSRQKIEDRKIVPVYKWTGRLAADIGTKALPESQFCLLRDINNGYGLVKHYLPTRKIPTMVVDPWKKN